MQKVDRDNKGQLLVDAAQEKLREIVEVSTGKLPQERLLAQQLGVSRQTLRQAMAELRKEGLIRSSQGRGTFVVPPLERRSVIHIISNSSSSPYNLTCVGVLSDVIRERGFSANLVCSQNPGACWDEVVNFSTNSVGSILVGCFTPQQLKDFSAVTELPFVHVSDADTPVRIPPVCNSITNDNAAFGFKATQCLIDRGHRKIGVITWACDTKLWDVEFIRGYRDAMRYNNLDLCDDWSVYIPPSDLLDSGKAELFHEMVAETANKVDQWKESGNQPTAMICAADNETGLRDDLDINLKNLFRMDDVVVALYWEMLTNSFSGNVPARAVFVKFEDIAQRAIKVLLDNPQTIVHELRGHVEVAVREHGKWRVENEMNEAGSENKELVRA